MSTLNVPCRKSVIIEGDRAMQGYQPERVMMSDRLVLERQLIHEKTTIKFLAALEYERWILRHSIWLGTPNGKYERHF
ncbi:hypothetical protein [Coleofasciculus sp. G2-EDA-02]|uniref:hypothetical protein n=1 Tax=Coleofasciculus sp. G2-EDA-02 TaxID=3069529 RepID=UPI0032F64C59